MNAVSKDPFMKKTLPIVIALCTLLSGCTLFEKQPASIDIIPAYKLYDEYRNNAIVAERTYRGKKVAISGWVYSAGQDITGQLYALLESAPDPTTSDPNPARVVCAQCMFKKESAPIVASLQKGDFVVALGKSYGFQTYVILTDCILGK